MTATICASSAHTALAILFDDMYADAFQVPKDPNSSQSALYLMFNQVRCRKFLQWICGNPCYDLESILEARGKVSLAYFEEFVQFMDRHFEERHLTDEMAERLSVIKNPV